MRKNRKLYAALLLGLLAAGTVGYGLWYGSNPKDLAEKSQTAETPGLSEGESTQPQDQAVTEILLSDEGSHAASTAVNVQGKHVLIMEAGIYRVTGSLSEGQLEVNCSGTVNLILDQVSITNSQEAALQLTDAEQVTISLAEGSENSLISGSPVDVLGSNEQTESGEQLDSEEDASGAALYAKDDLIIEGKGKLFVGGYINNGISTTDNLLVRDGNLEIEAVNNGLRGKDGVTIEAGTLSIKSSGDGIESKADLTICDGVIVITTGQQPDDNGMEGLEPLPQPEGMPQLPQPDDQSQAESSQGMPDVRPGRDPNFGGGQKFDRGQGFGGDQGFGGSQGFGGRQNFGGFSSAQQSGGEDDISRKGLKCEGTLLIQGGDITITSQDDCIHSNGSIIITDGTMSLATEDDGIHADGELTIEDGAVVVTRSKEGLEAYTIRVKGGEFSLTASDDGINASGEGDGLPLLSISGGTIYVNAGGDGLDSNGDLQIEGGSVIVDGPSDNRNAALDPGTESGGKMLSQGGTILAIGSSGMAECFDAESSQRSVFQVLSTACPAGTQIRILAADGSVLCEHTSAKAFNCIIFSSPELTLGDTLILQLGEEKTEITVSENSGFANRNVRK